MSTVTFAARDSATMLRRDLRHALRFPLMSLSSVMVPVLFLLDHATTARFAGRHEQELKALLASSVAACAREGLVSVDVVAGDGTKVKASASMAANKTGAELDAGIAALEEVIAAEVALWVEQHQIGRAHV